MGLPAIAGRLFYLLNIIYMYFIFKIHNEVAPWSNYNDKQAKKFTFGYIAHPVARRIAYIVLSFQSKDLCMFSIGAMLFIF